MEQAHTEKPTAPDLAPAQAATATNPEAASIWPTLAGAALGGALLGFGMDLVLLPSVFGLLSPAAALAGLWVIFRSMRLCRTAGRGALHGLAAFSAAAAAGLYWMACITFPAYIGVMLYFGIYGALFGTLSALIRRGTVGVAAPLALAALWAGLEFVRTWAFTGFPWMLAGSAWAGMFPAMGAADLGGVYLVSFITALVAALLVRETDRRFWPRVLLAAVLMVAASVYGVLGTMKDTVEVSPSVDGADTHRLRVVAVQPLIPFKVGPKSDPDQMQAVQTALCEQVEPDSTDLIVWSETMVPYDLLDQVNDLLAPLARAKRCCVLAGGVVHERDAEGKDTGRCWNSAVLVSPEGKVLGRYDKRHLVPFGEFVPMNGKFPGSDYVFKLIGTIFTPGGEHPLPAADGATVAVDICYEDCFPAITRSDARRGARVLVNLTNDSWFRQSPEARQHLALASFRAVETRRPLVRATNTGITALIDSDGEITAPPEGGLWQKGLVRMEASTGHARTTLYVAIGDAFSWLCLAGTLAAAGWGLIRPKMQSTQ